jgi:hypothetical protein
MSLMSSLYPEPTPLIPRRATTAQATGTLAPGLQRIGDHRIGDQGIGDQGIGDQGIGDQGIADQRIADQRIGDQRIGDAERAAVCEQLSGHYAAGRLTDDELDHRVTAAMAARTWADLRPLVGDLPSTASVRPTTAPVPTPIGTPWTALDVLALVALVGSVGIAVLGAMAVVLGGEPGYAVAAILTATTAGIGGMALTQVLHRGCRSIGDRADRRGLSGRA